MSYKSPNKRLFAGAKEKRRKGQMLRCVVISVNKICDVKNVTSRPILIFILNIACMKKRNDEDPTDSEDGYSDDDLSEKKETWDDIL